MRWVLIGGVAIVLFDVVSAFGSKVLEFGYGADPLGLILSLVITAIPAYLACRENGRIRTAVGVGAGVGLIDATIGWAAAWLIGPGAPRDLEGASPPLVATTVLLTIVLVVLFDAAIGLVAGWLSVRLGRRQPG